jgi:hypothetical protein
MGDEVKTIQHGIQTTCLSEQFGYIVSNVPVLADPVIAGSHGIGPVDIVVRNDDLIDYCDTMVDTNRTNHSSDSSNSITNPISDYSDRLCLNKHVNPIGMGTSRENNHRADTHVAESESKEETINRDTERTDVCDQSISIKHQTIPVAMSMEILEMNTNTASTCEGHLKSSNSVAESEREEETIILCDEHDNMKHQVLPVAAVEAMEINFNTAGTSLSAGGQLDPEVTSVNLHNTVTKTSFPEDIAEGEAPEISEVSGINVTTTESSPAVRQSPYPESVREVSALLERARCSSPPQTSPPPPAPQLAAVVASCSHSCGSLYAQCAANNHDPVRHNEILTEREQLPSYFHYNLDAVDYLSLDPLEEDEDTVLGDYHKQQHRVLMGNGASSGPCAGTSSNTAVTESNLQYAENGHPQKASPVVYANVFRMSEPEDYDYLKGLVPQLKREAKTWEAKSDSLETEVLELRRELKMREQEVVRLQREVHKLKVSDEGFGL